MKLVGIYFKENGTGIHNLFLEFLFPLLCCVKGTTLALLLKGDRQSWWVNRNLDRTACERILTLHDFIMCYTG